MEIKKQNAQSKLIEKRIEQLNKINNSGLRAYGKVLGMDMFLWLNPDLNELQNTLNSFPDPIIWFGNKHDIEKLTQSISPWNYKTHLLCSYDEAGFQLQNSIIDIIKNVLGSKSIDDALNLIPSIRKKQSRFIFTISGDNLNLYNDKIVQYIEKLKHS